MIQDVWYQTGEKSGKNGTVEGLSLHRHWTAIAVQQSWKEKALKNDGRVVCLKMSNEDERLKHKKAMCVSGNRLEEMEESYTIFMFSLESGQNWEWKVSEK